MHITEQWKKIPGILLLLTLASGVVACGTAGPDALSGANVSVVSDGVPEDLSAVLERDGIRVRGVAFESGEVSSADALDAFAKAYDPKAFETAPVPYSIAVEGSDETRLPEGGTAWMLHISGVVQDVSGPVHEKPDEGRSDPVRVDTDMFTFVDARSGEHLLTVYIGPEGSVLR